LTQEQSRIIELETQVASQALQIASQSQQIKDLLSQIVLLEEKLSCYQTKKNSSNSSIPPSQDPHRLKRTESLREKTGLKPGGQPGHEGNCLEKTMEPTEVVVHAPCYCTHCGKDLSGIPSEFIGSRQVIDIPPVQPTVTEHQIYSKLCQCGHLTASEYPAEAHSPVCYGSNLQALTAYFHARQYIPFERMRELYGDIFGLSISSGSLVNMVQTFANKSKGIYETIRERISQSSVVGADETGTCINGKNGWTWGFQTPAATYLYTIKSRGKAVIKKLFPSGFPETVLVHDCWPSYFSVDVQGHQICIAHLLRELKYIGKLYTQQWTVCFIALLLGALELKRNMRAEDYLKPVVEQRTELEKQLGLLLQQDIDPEHKKLVVFKERMVRYQNYLFPFLYRLEVPPDNNASERAMRTYKVKQKVSGLFRSEEGAQAFDIIRSVIDTTIKNKQNLWEALTVVAKLSG
jgi:transposase